MSSLLSDNRFLVPCFSASSRASRRELSVVFASGERRLMTTESSFSSSVPERSESIMENMFPAALLMLATSTLLVNCFFKSLFLTKYRQMQAKNIKERQDTGIMKRSSYE